MKETINNLLDSEEYTRQLEERRISDTNKVKIRLNEILDSNLNEGKESFYIYSEAFKTHDQFLMVEGILRENGWNVQHLFSQRDGDSMYVSLYEIV
jgi:hypothetical protein